MERTNKIPTVENLKEFFHSKINWKLYNAIDDAMINYYDENKYVQLNIYVVKSLKYDIFYNIFDPEVSEFSDNQETLNYQGYNKFLEFHEMSELINAFNTNGIYYEITVFDFNDNLIYKMKNLSKKFNMKIEEKVGSITFYH